MPLICRRVKGDRFAPRLGGPGIAPASAAALLILRCGGDSVSRQQCRRSAAWSAIGGLIKLRERTCVCARLSAVGTNIHTLLATSSASARLPVGSSVRPRRPSGAIRRSECRSARCVVQEIIAAGRSVGTDCAVQISRIIDSGVFS